MSLRVTIVTLLPEMLQALTDYGITGRAVKQGLLQIELLNPRNFTSDKHRTVDDRPYGGGPGMLMKVAPLKAALAAAGEPRHVVYLSPQGRKLDQQLVQQLRQHQHLVLLCGRYEGIDERLIEAEVDEEVSIGDFVLSGGELAAMTVLDAMIRLEPGALGHQLSAQQDSFVEGLLDHPHYTRPALLDGQQVPDVLLGGDHQQIRRWRLKQSLGRTWQRRPDLWQQLDLDDEQQALLAEYIRELADDG